MKQAIFCFALIALILTMISGCHGSLESQSPDDIVFPPGGPAYRANVHQQGIENPWPPIESTTVSLGASPDTVQITYRDHFQTKAGETRNNIFVAYLPNTQPVNGDAAVNLRLTATVLPAGISVSQGNNVHHADPARQTVTVYEIIIAPQVKTGEYAFQIGVEINGKNSGSVPCTVIVVQDVVTPQPITSPPPSKTDLQSSTQPPAGIGGRLQPRPLTEDEKTRVV
jgi:hypothetical protein